MDPSNFVSAKGRFAGEGRRFNSDVVCISASKALTRPRVSARGASFYAALDEYE
jgi:hypothetical protein